MEEAILLFIQNNIRNDVLNPIVLFITHLGDHAYIWIFISICLLLFKKTRILGIMVITSLCLSGIINNLILKNIVMRVRPFNAISELTLLIPLPTDYSFPSGHSASSFASAYTIYRNVDKRYGIILMVLALLISLSRLYVGAHYPSDVLGGIVSGILIARFTDYIFKDKILIK